MLHRPNLLLQLRSHPKRRNKWDYTNEKPQDTNLIEILGSRQNHGENAPDDFHCGNLMRSGK